MGFSDQQLYFAIAFFLAFIIAMIWAYRSDLKKLKGYEIGAGKVLIFIILVMSMFFLVIKFLGS
jgi:hypothetical protein